MSFVAMMQAAEAMEAAMQPEQDEHADEDHAEELHDDGQGIEAPKVKKTRARKPVPCHDLKKMFEAGEKRPTNDVVDVNEFSQPSGGVPLPSPARALASGQSGNLVLSALKIRVSSVQQVSEEGIAPPLRRFASEESTDRLERLILTAPVGLRQLLDAVPLLEAEIPLLESGKALFNRLPSAWLDVTGNNTAMGTRCLFASRRHECSVFEPLKPELMLQVPPGAKEWQLPLDLPGDAARVVEEEAWLLQVHPGRQMLRVLLRPGVLLMRMLRRGRVPAARFVWRVVDSTDGRDAEAEVKEKELENRSTSHAVGEFSILSNLEDAATTQPPNFLQYPLRREQLRSLGWMLVQEQRSTEEPFVTELREAVSCPDAPHWKLEGSLRCEYHNVKGGVLADAIGYGKTACTIGLVDKTKEAPLPTVPPSFRGFVPSRATLVLVPTNLHKQWLSEISKFTGDALKVISVPTCSQLKRLTLKELAEADIVVSTYRLFYSMPYLRRLEELARESSFGFTFPKQKGLGQAGEEWSQAYRSAFEALPGWAAKLGIETGLAPVHSFEGDSEENRNRKSKSKGSKESNAANDAASQAAQATQASQVSQASQKRRRVTGKQAGSSTGSVPQEAHVSDWPAPALQTQYVPLEVFWWKRIVCDEFHELLSRYPPAQVAVELFHADNKWGLSGTPPCQTLAQIRKAAGFLGVQLPQTPADTDKEEPRKVAQEWLDAFVRRNTAELPPLEEEERIVPVRQTVKERALYLALTQQHQLTQELGLTDTQSHDLPQQIKALKDVGQTTCGLLKLCSHFCFSGASDVLTAEDECQKQVALRRERILRAEREIKAQAERAASLAQLIGHFEPLFAKQPDEDNCPHICKESKGVLTARLKFMGVKALGNKAELQKTLLATAEQRSAGTRSFALARGFDAKLASKVSASLYQDTEEGGNAEVEWKKILDTLDADVGLDAAAGRVQEAMKQAVAAFPCQRRDPPARCAKLRKHLGMPQWSGSEEEHSDELAATNWNWRSVRENAQNLQKFLKAWKEDLLCSVQRLQASQAGLQDKLRSLSSFQDTLHASQAEAFEELQDEGSKFAKYGSKIETLVKHTQKIQQADPAAKMICFVQWEDLKRKISSALEEFGVPHHILQGSVWGRQAALRRFQYEDSGPRMLLLSLEESASGTNLTAANHVLIVHPMEAHSQEEAVAFEMQAVGRVRRPGQQKKIHIWRFVTLDTIEQQITEEHQKELWERQAVKIHIHEAAEQDSESELDCDAEADVGEAGNAAHVFEQATQCYMSTDPPMAKGIEEDEEVVIDNKTGETQADVLMGNLSEGCSLEDCEATQRYVLT